MILNFFRNGQAYQDWFVDLKVCASLDVWDNLHLLIFLGQDGPQAGFHLKKFKSI